MSNYHNKARELASRPYTLLIFREQTTDEEDFVYMATNPEFNGCKAQGLTMEEARENLDEVRVDMIEHLLEHSIEIPDPSWQKTDVEDKSKEFTKSMAEFFFENVTQNNQQQLFNISA